MQVFENCPHTHGKKKNCPYYFEVFGKCFSHCDLGSNLRCGDCAHWVGNCTVDEKPRHKLHGHCFYCIGGVRSDFRTNCKHYTERRSEEPNYIDWIEARVVELGGLPDNSSESRKLRIQARREWAVTHN